MTPIPKKKSRYDADENDFDEYDAIGMDGLLAATEKVLAVNRGLVEPDDRDSLDNDRIYTPDQLLSEHVKLDTNRVLRNTMGRLNRTRNLQGFPLDAFGDYTKNYITSNPLVPALEEVNPMHLMEHKRRVTKLGPGGVGDPNAITLDMQCHSDDTEVFTRQGWILWETVTEETELACRVDGRLEFHKPSALHAEFYEGIMYGLSDLRVDYLVTPNHRFWSASSSRTKEWKWQTAEEQFGKHRAHLAYSDPYAGCDLRDTFELDPPDVIPYGGKALSYPPLNMGDWCEFLGWYCSEGSCASVATAKEQHYSVVITQTKANPECVEAIDRVLKRLPFSFSLQTKNFVIHSKALHAFVIALGHRCWEKRIPEFIFDVKPEYRQRFLDAYAQGDGWQQKSGSWVYTTTSPGMCQDLERLVIGMGFPSSCGTPWMCKRQNGEPSRLAYRTSILTSKIITVRPSEMRTADYCGMVYCATVPGGLLLTRRGYGSKPIWTGNSVHGSQFGFIDPLAGPECLPEESEVYTRRGWMKWKDVSDTEQFACRIDGRFAWGAASRIVRQPYVGKLIVAESSTLLMKATPNHRVLFKRDAATKNFSVSLAAEVFGKPIRIPRRHLPQAGDDGMTTFTLPEIDGTNGNQKRFAPFDIVDWCAYMGWWLSEGNSHTTQPGRLTYATGRVCITQCRVANPENYAEIRALCLRMGICDCDNGRTFISGAKQLVSYFSQWQNGCYDKWIPEELFHAPLKARQALLDALIKGDGRSPRNRLCYCTVSRRLAESVERLAVELGYAAYIREEKDNRPHVITTNYVVSMVRTDLATIQQKTYVKKQNGTTTGNNWSTEDYDGVVCCATVPGGFLYVRGASNHPGYWTGNSEKAGVDVRLSYGTRIGSNGRVYQKFRNRKTGKMEWLDSAAIRDKVVRLPD